MARGAPGLAQSTTADESEDPELGTKQGAAKADESSPAEAGEATGPGEESGESSGGESSGDENSSESSGDENAGELSESARIVEAIEKGEMRAVDLILIAKTSELSAWRDAANRCRS